MGEGVFAWEDNRTGLADIYCSKVLWGGPWVNVEEVNEHLVQLYPNPSSDLVYLSLNSDVRVHLSVFAMNGKKMVSEVINQSKIEMHVADWPAGLYCIQIRSNNKIEHLQFVKQ